ncbi:MAG TPA: hypothetical protein VHS99_04560, partial [Chloroflexota bacterium]|nr:hypothetical protein [Chloroflexota bacterium]
MLVTSLTSRFPIPAPLRRGWSTRPAGRSRHELGRAGMTVGHTLACGLLRALVWAVRLGACALWCLLWGLTVAFGQAARLLVTSRWLLPLVLGAGAVLWLGQVTHRAGMALLTWAEAIEAAETTGEA